MYMLCSTGVLNDGELEKSLILSWKANNIVTTESRLVIRGAVVLYDTKRMFQMSQTLFFKSYD